MQNKIDFTSTSKEKCDCIQFAKRVSDKAFLVLVIFFVEIFVSFCIMYKS